MSAVIWSFFLLGQFVHLLLQVWAIVTAPNSPATTWQDVVRSRWPAFLARSFVCTMLFWLWLDGQLISAMDGIGVNIPSWVRIVLGLHVSGAIAGLAGYAADSILAFIPWFKSSVPTV